MLLMKEYKVQGVQLIWPKKLHYRMGAKWIACMACKTISKCLKIYL